MWKYRKIIIKKFDRNIEFVDIIYSLLYMKKLIMWRFIVWKATSSDKNSYIITFTHYLYRLSH
jgi:hypothetical protein